MKSQSHHRQHGQHDGVITLPMRPRVYLRCQFLQCLRQYLYQVLRAFAGEVFDLLPAGDSGGDDVEVAIGGLHFGLHGREQPPRADGARQVIVLMFKPKRSRHAATAGIDFVDLEAGRQSQHGERRSGADQRLLVAMAVQ